MEHIQRQEDELELNHLLGGSSIYSLGREHPKSPPGPNPTWFRIHATGWRFGVITCASWSIIVFVINLIIFVWAESRQGFPGFSGDGKHPIYEGDCEVTRKLNIAVHVLINTLSTILLSASNYCMQCMSAPTRKEIDKAHGNGKWLDVGIQSVRNISTIDKKRASLYFLLGLSSLPLHLFYNSTVFSSIAATNYHMYSANEAFSDPSSKNYTLLESPCPTYDKECLAKVLAHRLFNESKSGNFAKLDKLACINAYSIPFQTNRGSLILVVPNTTIGFDKGVPTVRYEGEEAINDNEVRTCPKGPFSWICPRQACGDQCQFNVGNVKKNFAGWKPYGAKVLYCLSEPIEQHCRLLYSAHLATTVIMLNAFKASIMLYIALGIKQSPLMTMGDAVSSFIHVSDATTAGMCLASRKDIKISQEKGLRWPIVAKAYSSVIHSRSRSSSKARWTTMITLFSIAIAVVIGLLAYGIQEIKGPKGINTIMSLGLGAINPATFISWSLPSSGASGIILNVLVANSPQVVLSFLYFAYNGIFTCMSLASEWSRYSINRKGLRVSDVPRGAQRSTYFLQLPYRFAIPLMITSGSLHWLVSQSIFLVTVDTYSQKKQGNRDRSEDKDYMTCGYSPVAMIAVIVVGFCMLGAALITSRLKLKSGMPVVASCSAAISAACHPGKEDRDGTMAFLKLRWGALPVEGEVGHCSFTTDEVEEPVDGKLYAGF